MKAAKSSPAIAAGRRRAELAAIHVAVKQLGLDDLTYRTFLFTTTGRRSAAELSDGQRQQVIELLRSRGFRRTPAEERRARRMGDNRQLAMVRGLWKKLLYAGALADPSERHLSAFRKEDDGDRVARMAKSGTRDSGYRGDEELAR
jgi:phage gp16-like protein